MKSRTDQQLLAEYAQQQSEGAFAELVSRFIDLIHSAAMRMVRDPQLAEDVTQGVFLALARNAGQLADRPVLAGWLHRTAQNLAANAIRSDARRRAREKEAAAMNQLLSESPDASWDQLAPHLDAALGELAETDRDAVLLRYFQKKSAQEMAETLGVSAEAAQKRVSRAVERLRESLAKRGVAAGAGGLVLLLSTHAVQAAPLALAASVSTAIAGSLAPAVSVTATATGTLTATKAIAMTTLQKTLVTVTVVVLAGAGIYEAREASHLRQQVDTLTQEQAQQQVALDQQVRQMQRERDAATNEVAALLEEKARQPDYTAELLRLRGMAGVARRAIAESEQLRKELAKRTAEPATNPITGAMADAMKQAMEQQVETRLSRMMASLQLTPEQADAAREILTRQARAMSAGMQQGISGKFDKAELTRLSREAGNVDEQIKALLTPEQRAAFPNYQREEASHNAGLAANQELLQMQTTLGLAPEQVDRVYASLYELSFNQLTRTPPRNFANQVEATQWMLDQKTQALSSILTETQLHAFNEQQARQLQLVRDLMDRLENSSGSK